MSLNDKANLSNGYVAAASATATGTLVSTKGALRGAYLRTTGVAGTAVFRNGGGAGTTILTVNTPAQVGDVYIPVPGNGIEFGTDLHVTLTSVDGVTAFYTDLS